MIIHRTDMFNSTHNHHHDEIYYNEENFSFSYDDEPSISLNRSYYDDLFLNLNPKLTKTSFFSFSSPFTYIFLIIICYLILTIVLLTFTLYKQRQTEMENFYFGDSDEDIEQGKRHFAWKQFLIGKIRKGDMQPLLSNDFDQQRKTDAFPIYIV
ncbi:hypothetical protein I4U23_026886 [Adineta vaga]|nr:hypothetical protein I4U23_026886 [Adineta vaga]